MIGNFNYYHLFLIVGLLTDVVTGLNFYAAFLKQFSFGKKIVMQINMENYDEFMSGLIGENVRFVSSQNLTLEQITFALRFEVKSLILICESNVAYEALNAQLMTDELLLKDQIWLIDYNLGVDLLFQLPLR